MCRLAYALVLAFGVSSGAGKAQVTPEPGYVQLKLDGRYLSWNASPSGAIKLKWSLATGEVNSNGVGNCGRMKALAGLGKNISRTILQHEAAAAFEFWQKSASLNFEYVADPSYADILIGAQANPDRIAFADVIYTAGTHTMTGQITKGLICLNDEAEWKTGFDGNLKSFDLRFVLAHEIGHVIGLDHPSSSGQLMSYRYDEVTRHLRDGDIAGVTQLYGRRQIVNAQNFHTIFELNTISQSRKAD